MIRPDTVPAPSPAIECGISVVPGSEQSLARWENAKGFIEQHGLPVILKAALGGGGRGMRVIRDIKNIQDSFDRATSEALKSFGNGSVFIEKFVEKPRHIEVQILADNYGNVVHLFEPTVLQRRHQKVVEMAPARNLSVGIKEERGWVYVAETRLNADTKPSTARYSSCYSRRCCENCKVHEVSKCWHCGIFVGQKRTSLFY